MNAEEQFADLLKSPPKGEALGRRLTELAGRLSPAALSDMLREEFKKGTTSARKSLMRAADVSLLPLLEAGLGDPVERVREHAVRGLARLENNWADALLTQTAFHDPSRRIRLSAIRAAVHERRHSLRPMLERILAESKDREIVEATRWALDRLQEESRTSERRIEAIARALGGGRLSFLVHCHPGAEDVLLEELTLLGGEAAAVPENERGAATAVFTGAHGLLKARTALSAELLIDLETAGEHAGLERLRALGPLWPDRRGRKAPVPFDPGRRPLEEWLALWTETTPYASQGMRARLWRGSVAIEAFPPEAFARSYRRRLGPTSLHPALAAVLVRLSEPAPNQRFLDPLCGTGTIVIERALAGTRAAMLLGGDVNSELVRRARANAEAAGVAAEFRVMDARRLPLSDASVDRIVSDLPFGVRSGSAQENEGLYPALLAEIERVLRPGGRAVLLTMSKQLLRRSCQERPGLRLAGERLIESGGLSPSVFLIERA